MSAIRCRMDAETLEVMMYGTIGSPEPDANPNERFISKDDLAAVIAANSACKSIRLRISSPGGSVDHGLAMYNYLKSCGKPVSCVVDSIAASIATVIMCAGTVQAPKNSMIILHKPMTSVEAGNSDDMKDALAKLETLTTLFASIYSAKIGCTETEARKFMDDAKLMTAEQAKEIGLVDEILEPEEMGIAAHIDIEAAKAKLVLDAKAVAQQTPFIPADMLALLNRQVGRELYVSNFYKQASSVFQSQGLKGFERYCRRESAREMDHAMWILQYITDAGAKVEIPAIEAPAIDAKAAPLDIAQGILNLEMGVTQDWTAIAELAKQQENAATQSLAQYFMVEQQASENEVLTLYQKVKLADSGTGILLIDSNLTDNGGVIMEAKKEEEAVAKAEQEAKAKTELEAKAKQDAEAKAKQELEAKAKATDEFKAMAKTFGPELAGKYFDKGLTLEQAKDQHIQELRAENGKIRATNTELETALAVFRKHPSIPFDAHGEIAGTGEMRVSEAEFTAYCKDRGITDPKRIEAMRAEMLKNPVK